MTGTAPVPNSGASATFPEDAPPPPTDLHSSQQKGMAGGGGGGEDARGTPH
jgi:hypothetical protein